MNDPRIEKLARVLAEYSLGLKPRDVVSVQGEAGSAPLIEAFYRAAMRRGAFVVPEVGLKRLVEIFYEEASTEQLEWLSPFALQKARKADAMLRIAPSENPRALSRVDPRRIAASTAARKSLNKITSDRAASGALRWTLTQWPCDSVAREAGMGLDEYIDFVFQAGNLDDADPVRTWQRISARQQALADYLNTASTVRIVAEDTDVSFSLKGRRWLNSDGQRNFPDGEVYTGPVEESVEGWIKFSFPAVRAGRDVEGVRLKFSEGRVVKAEAEKGQDYLRAMLATDPGASYVGEAAVGTNYSITRFTRNTLFDEKIGGSIHLALGSGFPDTGNKNRSGLHWDMVCDLRGGGELYADGVLFQKNGRFLNRKFPQPKQNGTQP